MIGPIKGRLLEVCLLRSNIEMIDKKSLKKFGLGTWSFRGNMDITD